MEKKVPIIDLSEILGNFETKLPSSFQKVATQFGEAMSGIGFAYLINHGVDMEKVENIYKLSRSLFSLPKEAKGKYKKPNPAECFQGYVGPGDHLESPTENSIELRELFDVWGFEQFSESHFPAEVPGFKTAFDNIRPECTNLTKKLLLCLGQYLKEIGAMDDVNFFLEHHKWMDDPRIRTQSQFRTINYYKMDPTDPNIPEDAIRCGEHSDWGTITLLFQDEVGGLEVKRRNGGWIEAVPIPGSILVNGAQLLEHWTAGVFPATPHRVRIQNEERTRNQSRQSFIHFINPDGDSVVKSMVKCPPGNEAFLKLDPKHSYDHYKRLIQDATNKY